MKQSKPKLEIRKYIIQPNPNEKIWKSFEPKMNNRFMVTIGSPWEIPSFVIKSITKPIIAINGGVLNKLELILYDPITPSTSQAIWEGIGILQTKPDGYLTELKIEMLGPVGDVVEQYKLKGTFISFDFGTLDWEDSNLSTITALFQVSECKFQY